MNDVNNAYRLCLAALCVAGLALTASAQTAPQSESPDARDNEDSLQRTTTVGPVEATVRLQPAKPLIGDAVRLLIEVRAETGIELLMPEFGEALERFTIIDFAPRPERIGEDGRTIAEQRYTLQPQMSGSRSIPPILVEFVDRRPGKKPAPDGEDAYELLTERLDFEVQSVVPDGAAAELKAVLGKLDPIQRVTATQWSIGIGTILAVLIGTPFAIRAYLQWRRLAQRRSAYEIAVGQLDRLLAGGLPDSDAAIDPFFVRLSDIIRSYIENRFELRAPEYTTEEFLDTASASPDFTLEHQQILREFLRQADLVKFAHLQPTADDIHKSITLARQFLDDTQQDAPLIDEGDGTADAAQDNRKVAAGV